MINLRRFMRVCWPPVVAAVVCLILWDVVIQVFEIKRFLAPRPHEMFAALIADREVFAKPCWLTGKAAASGLILSVIVGTLIGVLFAEIPFIRRGLYPYAIFLQTVPIVALAPLLVLWIGNGIASVIAVAFILSLFPIITNVTVGMMSVRPDLLELFNLNRATWWQRFRKLQFPSTIPNLMTGIKVSGGLAVIGAIVGEFFVGYGSDGKGLGYLIRQAVEMNRTERLFAVVLLSTLLGISLFGLTNLISETALRKYRTGN